ncbi:MAG: hypothetical protein V3T83_14630 [Acidobacteriota bacterium]
MLQATQIHPAHIACIFGGAVAGSETAHQLAQRGIYSVVFDQEALPYGKIEHGLPKWHIKLRDKEERQIDEKLCSPYVTYVPHCKLGREISFEEVQRFGFSATLLAVGAWRDRPLPVPGVDEFIGRGFYYQNPYVMWFNQYHSPRYQGEQCEVHDHGIVVGGGLASIDVVKILMLETTLRALKERGLEANLFRLEKKGIPFVLKELGVSWQELGLKGCTLFYRRRNLDMPLNEVPSGIPPERAEKMKLVRQKLMRTAQAKYLFHFRPCSVPLKPIVEEGRLAGLAFCKTELRGGKATALEGSEFEVRSPLTISSIGSLPEPLEGLPMKWNLLDVESEETGKVAGFDNVFALGNTVTGRGNIRASLLHGRQVAGHLMEDFLAWSEQDYQKLIRLESDQAARKAERIADFLKQKHLQAPDQIEQILDRVKDLQRRSGYQGDYAAWAQKNAFTRLEHLIGYEG